MHHNIETHIISLRDTPGFWIHILSIPTKKIRLA